MGQLIKIQNERGLAKDPLSGAVVSTDAIGYSQYVNRRSSFEHDRKKIREYEQQVQELCTEISEIKTLLKQLLNK